MNSNYISKNNIDCCQLRAEFLLGMAIGQSKLLCPSLWLLPRGNYIQGQVNVEECPAPLPGFGTALRDHPSSRAPTELTKASLATASQFYFSL